MKAATWLLRIVSPFLGIYWNLQGYENIPENKACIVIANHQSSIDLLGMAYLWPIFKKLTAIAKEELFYVIPFGLTAWLCGIRFIKRGNSQKAKESMSHALKFVKENKAKLWIFPEGTRSMTGKMLPFKKGAFYLAITGQVPILPVVFSSYQGFLNHKLKIFNPGNVIISCLPLISTEGLTPDDIPSLMEDVHMKMMEIFDDTSKKIQQPFPLEDGACVDSS